MCCASKKPTVKGQPKNGSSRFFWEVSNNQSDNDVTKATKPKFYGYKFTNFIRTVDPAICLVLTQAATAFTVYNVMTAVWNRNVICVKGKLLNWQRYFLNILLNWVITINYICCKMENDRSYTRQFVLSAGTYDDDIEIIRTIVHRESYVYWTVHHLDSWIKIDQPMSFVLFFAAQRVSNASTFIFRSLRLCVGILLWFDVCWRCGVAHQFTPLFYSCPLIFCLKLFGWFISDTCWTTPQRQHTSNQSSMPTHSRKLLKMNVLAFKTRWAAKNKTSDISWSIFIQVHREYEVNLAYNFRQAE